MFLIPSKSPKVHIMVVAVLKISVPCESGCKRGFTENIVTTKGQQFGRQCLIKSPYYPVPRATAVQTSGIWRCTHGRERQ
jgi:hypothetical protein